jgi:hypothetical protein
MWPRNAVAVAYLASAQLVAQQKDPSIFQKVAGTWDWVGVPGECRDNPHTISFDEDGPTMVLRYAKPAMGFNGQTHTEARYEIRSWSDDAIRVFLVAPPETRTTDKGQLVVWDLVLNGRNRYRWHRTDWARTGFTRDVRRCSQ